MDWANVFDSQSGWMTPQRSAPPGPPVKGSASEPLTAISALVAEFLADFRGFGPQSGRFRRLSQSREGFGQPVQGRR